MSDDNEMPFQLSQATVTSSDVKRENKWTRVPHLLDEHGSGEIKQLCRTIRLVMPSKEDPAVTIVESHEARDEFERESIISTLQRRQRDINMRQKSFDNQIKYDADEATVTIRLNAAFSQKPQSEAKVDRDMLDTIMQYRWGAMQINGKVYAFTLNHNAHSTWLHEFVANEQKPSWVARFNNGDTLDCRSANIALISRTFEPHADEVIEVAPTGENGKIPYVWLEGNKRWVFTWKVGGKRLKHTVKLRDDSQVERDRAYEELLHFRQVIIEKQRGQAMHAENWSNRWKAPEQIEARLNTLRSDPDALTAQRPAYTINEYKPPNFLPPQQSHPGGFLVGSIHQYDTDVFCWKYGRLYHECKHFTTGEEAKRAMMEYSRGRSPNPCRGNTIQLLRNNNDSPTVVNMEFDGESTPVFRALFSHVWCCVDLQLSMQAMNHNIRSPWQNAAQLVTFTLLREKGLAISPQDLAELLQVYGSRPQAGKVDVRANNIMVRPIHSSIAFGNAQPPEEDGVYMMKSNLNEFQRWYAKKLNGGTVVIQFDRRKAHEKERARSVIRAVEELTDDELTLERYLQALSNPIAFLVHKPTKPSKKRKSRDAE